MAVLYGPAAWVILQVADVLVRALALPGWVLPGISLLLILGFPLMRTAAADTLRIPSEARSEVPLLVLKSAPTPWVRVKVAIAVNRQHARRFTQGFQPPNPPH